MTVTADDAIAGLERSLRNVPNAILHIGREEAEALVAPWRTPTLDAVMAHVRQEDTGHGAPRR